MWIKLWHHYCACLSQCRDWGTRGLDSWHSITDGGTVLYPLSHPDWLHSPIVCLLSEHQRLCLYSDAHHSTPPCAINLYLVPPEALSVQWGPSFNSTLCHKPVPSTARGSVSMARHIKQLHCAINLYIAPQFNNQFHYGRFSLHKILYLLWD